MINCQETEQFKLIVLLSTLLFLKEKQNKEERAVSVIINKSEVDIEKLTGLVSKIETFLHIPDKKSFVQEAFKKLGEFILKDDIDESNFFTYIHSSTDALDKQSKKDILNAVICIAFENRSISDREKEVIIQTSYALGFKSNYETIFKEFKYSRYWIPISNYLIVLIGMLMILFLGFGSYFYSLYIIQKRQNEVKIFESKDIFFSEISFNRFVTYQNRASLGVENYFKKQAIFYFSGVAQIGFDSNDIEYNKDTKTITYNPKSDLFKVKLDFDNEMKIDEVKPEKISKESAEKISALIGIGGAYFGAKVGSSLSSGLVPLPSSSLIGGGVGALAMGASAYYFSVKALDGASFSKEISMKEMEIVKENSKEIIKSTLIDDLNLQKIYKQKFKEYIKEKYERFKLEVKKVKIGDKDE